MSLKCDECGNQLDTAGNCRFCLMNLGVSQSSPGHAAGAGMELPSIEQLNDQFPQLTITRLIGQGGMGAIYQARQTNLDRDVALKIIYREVARDQAFSERFEREAKTLAKLAHPNIVTVYDYGQTVDGLPYLIMEYVDGINLREAITSQSLGSDDALDVVATICGALSFAHNKGVVHRDIKPENILLGEDGTIKVADFGIAKILDDSIRTPTLTATRQVLGTLHYLAPEHLESPEEVDHRVDLYGLGVVFYELLTGQLPLGRYEPPSVLHPGLSADIDPIVLKSLHRKPKSRYQSANEMQSAIAEVQGGESPRPRSSSSSSSATASVPFTCEAMGGFAEAVGILYSDGGIVRAEYRVRDAIWGNMKSKTHVVEIPLEKLSSVELQSGLFSSKIVMVADTIATLGKLPNAETGRVEFKVKRGDHSLAQAVVAAAGGEDDTPPAVESVSPQDDSAKQSLAGKWTTAGVLLCFCGIVNAGCLAIFEAVNMSELRGIEFIAASVGGAIVLGPIALLQFVTGALCLFVRPSKSCESHQHSVDVADQPGDRVELPHRPLDPQLVEGSQWPRTCWTDTVGGNVRNRRDAELG